jgi:hypothetical protein
MSIEEIVKHELYQKLETLKDDISRGNIELTFDINRITNNWNFKYFNFKKKLIKELLSTSILSGSQALYCYKVNGKYIFNRKPKDWDFLMNEYEAYHFCLDKKHNFSHFTDKYFIDLNETLDSYGHKTNKLHIMLRNIKKDEYDMYSNVKVSSIQRILLEKINFFRNKDILDIKEVLNNIYDNKE